VLKRILVPLDGSALAELALPVAARLARAGGGRVVLARVIGLPTSSRFGASPPAPMETMLVDERAAATRYLEEVSRRPELVDVTTQVETRVATAVAPALLEIMKTSQADLVVMCSHGRTGFTRWRLGSVAQKVARHATIPTLLLHADGPALFPTSPGEPRLMRALVPLDGSPEAETALEPAGRLLVALAAPAQGALHLLHVLQLEETSRPAPDAEHNAQDSLRLEAERYLGAVAERVKQASPASPPLAVTWSIVFDPDVAAAILSEEAAGDGSAEDAPASAGRGYDMIAMTSHGRSGFQLWALGSVADRVLQTSTLPLLIVHLQNSSESQRIPRGTVADRTEAEIAEWPGY
jgi:nucleotide-binding universal stress UspA family protein